MAQEPTSLPTIDGGHDPSVVESLLHPQAVTIRRLLTPAERRELSGVILVDDGENIAQAISAGVTIRALFHTNDTDLDGALLHLLPRGVEIYTVQRRTCKKLFGNEKVSRIFAIADEPPPQSLASILATGRDVVVLDGICIAGNVGAIIRTAAAMGAGGIAIVNSDSLAVFDRRVIRASRGHVFGLGVVKATTPELLRLCSAGRQRLVVTTPRSGTPLGDLASLNEPLVLVYGAEKQGCSAELLEAAGCRVAIPMAAGVESLNVAAAAAITLHSRCGFNLARPTP